MKIKRPNFLTSQVLHDFDKALFKFLSHNYYLKPLEVERSRFVPLRKNFVTPLRSILTPRRSGLKAKVNLADCI